MTRMNTTSTLTGIITLLQKSFSFMNFTDRCELWSLTLKFLHFYAHDFQSRIYFIAQFCSNFGISVIATVGHIFSMEHIQAHDLRAHHRVVERPHEVSPVILDVVEHGDVESGDGYLLFGSGGRKQSQALISTSFLGLTARRKITVSINIIWKVTGYQSKS